MMNKLQAKPFDSYVIAVDLPKTNCRGEEVEEIYSQIDGHEISQRKR